MTHLLSYAWRSWWSVMRNAPVNYCTALHIQCPLRPALHDHCINARQRTGASESWLKGLVYWGGWRLLNRLAAR
jgi:hypothetical protein